MKIITASIIFVLFYFIGNAQLADSVVIKVVRKEASKDYNLYSITVYNWGKRPAAILHSATIFLWTDPPPKFAIDNKEPRIEYFSLNYSLRDEDFSHFHNNLNAELVLPLQHYTFDVAIPNSSSLQKLKIEYILLTDLHYNSFKQDIYEKTQTWYKEYERRTKLIQLPDNSFPVYSIVL